MDWRKFISADFWSKKEISYQYVHFTNSAAIAFVAMAIYRLADLSGLVVMLFATSGFLAGCLVELKQWIGGNHKVEDMVRDLVFWALGNIVGLIIFYK